MHDTLCPVASAALLARRPTVGALMVLCEENYARLSRLIPGLPSREGRVVSHVEGAVDLHLTIEAQSPYTTLLRLTHVFGGEEAGRSALGSDPDVRLRVYHDARLVEATHCYVGRRWQDTLGLHPPPRVLLDHRLRLNTFIGKWLDYLVLRGHSRFTLAQHGANDDNARRTSA